MLPDELFNGILNRRLGKIQNGMTIALLVAGIGKGVKRKGVLVGRGDFLFDQHADNASFVRFEVDVHVDRMTPVCWRPMVAFPVSWRPITTGL